MIAFLGGLALLFACGWWLYAHRPAVKRPWRICAWCEGVEEFGDEGAYETHTICPRCLEKWNAAVDHTPRRAA